MALEPMAYVQKIYAGFLGMNIGIRLLNSAIHQHFMAVK